MDHAGPVIGMPFSLEGFAFFTEAIFLGIYLYGWQRVSHAMHIVSGIIVALSGLASAAFVLVANAWMNVPRGFRVVNGRFIDIDPIAAMYTPFAAHEILHMVVAAYMATGFAVAGIHAFAILRGSATGFHRRALTISLFLAIPFALVQPLIGDFAGKQVARYQPLKLAAMERLERTEKSAPIRIGPIEVPGALSWIAYGDRNAVVRGLREWPRSDWPHPIVRTSFRAMVALGMWMAAVSAYAILLRLRRRPWTDNRLLLWLLVITAPMGFLAIEFGWIVTEMGRQPWIIYGVMRTAASVTPMRGLAVPFAIFMAVYALLSVTVISILRSQVRSTIEERE
jgi:cytochrome d ubiquinol oxidase subunit I